MLCVGANYRASCRARSDAEMNAKLGTVEEEGDETQFWMEVLEGAELLRPGTTERLHGSHGRIVGIIVASRRTLHKRIGQDGNKLR
jgi:four helix bundle protein